MFGEGQNGMSLRDWYAGKALQGLTAAMDMAMCRVMMAKEQGAEHVAIAAYNLADAMLAARTPEGV